MLKNFKGLFVKAEEEEPEKKELEKKKSDTESYSFPIDTPPAPFSQQNASLPSLQLSDPSFVDVLKVYEAGLESINMPGYDFYEFYQAISLTGHNSEQAYNIAYQMARTMDKTITTQKLVHDAEFYISKINEVHSQYVAQGQQKLSSLQEKKNQEKAKLNAEIEKASSRISHLKAELNQLEIEIHAKKNELGKIEDSFTPQEKSVREKLTANDLARQKSIDKLGIIKEGILRYIKG